MTLITIDICALQADIGSCNGSITHWYFNKEEEKCEQFTYSGCDGNRNNFETINDCLHSCCKNCSFNFIIPLLVYLVSCPTGIQRLSCDTDPCVMAQCTNHPDAYCVTENCGLCSHRFYNSTGNDVTDECGNIIPLLTIIHLHACR